MFISEKIRQIKPSVTLAAATKARALKKSGKDVVSLTVGEPDFRTPQHISDAAIASITSGAASYYTPTAGIPELIQAIIQRTETDYGLIYQENNIVVTDGAKFALYALFQAILEKEDEVIIPVPYWVSYSDQVRLADGKPVFVAGLQENGFKVTVSQLEAAYTPKTKAIIINSPSNPTGMIYTKDELEAIGNWAVANNVLIIADDIYGKLVYDGNVFTPIATISDAIRRQTIIINGVSKSYAMTGWRIGYAIGDPEIISSMIKIISQSTSNCAAVSQYAAVEALSGKQDTVEEMRQAFEERLHEAYEKVKSIPGFKLQKPQGAFYLFPDVSEAMALCGYDNVTQWVEDLLAESYVAVVTGEGFGSPNHIRLSYATDMATFDKAVERIKAFISKKQGQ